MAEYDDKGREIPDPTPIELPRGYKAPESLNQIVKRLVQQELSAQAVDEGFESFEEADDFEVDDDGDLDFSSQYEFDEMSPDLEIGESVPLETGGKKAPEESKEGPEGPEVGEQ